MKAALTALLLADPDLQARIGSRINWGTPPAHAAGFPCLNLTMVSAPVTYTLDGEVETQSCTVQVDAWAQTASEAEVLRWEVRSLLSGYRGTTGGVRFRGAFVRGSRDLDGRGLGDLGPLFGMSIDLSIRWNAA
ncbi:Protein of unknown function [Pseudooceanicola antarcticus]|uniref:DUF3168 domain-containing protein n=1 Tax=Pseudooceanicola antarcticus TaxID=1247613 RepID=A0A285J560_9RHOB|nr:DUF3168 domain-containing protein [Pseudooceanicola antarcticus]PJE26815.1 DUF3168 domain-containing protein [Pseudooceanicola antarcticus]SNY55352.1 Protein of unknown function [Pseudooceanicola antarcticus]